MNVFYGFWKIAKILDRENILYALVREVAIAFHSIPRFTKDIDIMIEPSVLQKVSEVLIADRKSNTLAESRTEYDVPQIEV